MLFTRILILLANISGLVFSQAHSQQTLIMPDFYSQHTFPSTEGKAPFVIPSNGALAETWYIVYGDLKESTQVPLVVAHGGGATHHLLKTRT